ncbi:MAG: hypothetical protein ABI317_09500 [Gaiellales bacterium]
MRRSGRWHSVHHVINVTGRAVDLSQSCQGSIERFEQEASRREPGDQEPPCFLILRDRSIPVELQRDVAVDELACFRRRLPDHGRLLGDPRGRKLDSKLRREQLRGDLVGPTENHRGEAWADLEERRRQTSGRMPAEIIRAPEEALHDIDPVVRELDGLTAGVHEKQRAEVRGSVSGRDDAQECGTSVSIDVFLVAKRDWHQRSDSSSLALSEAVWSS